MAGFSDDVWRDPSPVKSFVCIAEPGDSMRCFEVVSTPVFHADGSPNLLLIYGREITESCAADMQIRLAEHVLKSGSKPTVITDAGNRIMSINPALTAVTGYADAEVLGKNPKVFASGCHPPAFYRSMWDRINAAGSWHGVICDRKKNGELHTKWLDIRVIQDARGISKNYLGIYSDPADPQIARRINSS